MLAIFACSENTGTSPGKVEDNRPFGWLEGGFTPETRFDRGGGLQKVAHSGDWIVLMDAWTSPVDSNDTLFGNYTYTPRLFISKIGSDPVVPPPKTRVRMLYADEGGTYAGTYASAEILQYHPFEKSWNIKKIISVR